MAAVYGHVGPFDENIEKFADYAGRYEAFMVANEIAEDRQVHVFLAVVGPQAYKLLKNLCDPDNPNSKSYEELKQILQAHYEPAPIVIAERHKFWTASQEENESVSDFVVRLKKLASTCSFGAFLEEALRDRLVSGLHPKMSRTQRHLLAVRELTFTAARDRCIADELANKANKEHMGEPVSEEANKIQDLNQGNGRKSTGGRRSNSQRCEACGSKAHGFDVCKFKTATCHRCQKKGHIRPVCKARLPESSFQRKSSNSRDMSVNNCEFNPQEGDDSSFQMYEDSTKSEDAEGFGLYRTGTDSMTVKPYVVSVQLGNATVSMEVDTGASRSTVSQYVYNTLLTDFPLQNTDVTLRSYSGEKVPILGKISVPVKYSSNDEKVLDLVVVQGKRPALFGRDWLSKIRLDWESIFSVTEHVGNRYSVPKSEIFPPELNTLLEKNKDLFSNLGSGIKGFTGTLTLKPDFKPVFQKDRPVPYSLVSQVEKEYDKLVEADILYPVSHSSWASPVVRVPKADGSIRVCGDYKALNDRIDDDLYKLPNVQDMFAMLSQDGSTPDTFSVTDLASAFNQLFLDDESSELLTINTRKGLFRSKRLCFGVKTATAQFQRVMDAILSGIKGVMVRVDDILVATSGGVSAHLEILKQVFSKLAKHNVRLSGPKCQFLKDKVKYMGHILSKQGISPVKSKLEAIQQAPRPADVSQLRSFLGMINYYSKFIPDFSSKLHPLYELLSNKTKWFWSESCEAAFLWAKEVLSSDQVLVHYDPSKPLVLSVDAGPHGIGAVLSHRLGDGSEKPIEYASRTLTMAERNYAQIEKEGLAIVFGIKRFNLYLYGRKFTLFTDHQPLTRIFGPKSGIPPLAAARLQRWAVLLSGYDYDIVYKRSADNANADFFSRFPVQTRDEEDSDPDEHYVFATAVSCLPVIAVEIADLTKKDKVLVKVYEYTSSGWPNHCPDPEIKPYWNRREDLSLEDGCLLWGRRVVIPLKLQGHLLDELHECHPGMCRMKVLARSFVWWPGIDQDIEDRVRFCEDCVNAQSTPKSVPLLFWPWATEPWQRIHVDFAEVKGQQFFIIVDSHSKWLEVFPMTTTTATATINVLRAVFARYGLPHEVVSDNGPQFVSEEYQTFLKMNRIKLTLVPPYHPASNGLAERHVRTFKGMYKAYGNARSVQHRVADILFRYRNTPHSTTGKTPAELFLKREPRTFLSLVKPSLKSRVESRQAASKLYQDGAHPKLRTFDLHQPVRVKNVRGGKEKWIQGTIVAIKGPETYLARVPGNNRRFVHANHLIPDDARGQNAEKENIEREIESAIPLLCRKRFPRCPKQKHPANLTRFLA